jgi:recombination protein RecA
MSKKKKDEQLEDDFTNELINQINKAHNDKIAFNLGTEEAPTNVKRWIRTGSRQLDFIIANQLEGGLPEGRIIEIQGPASSGKSHIAFEVAKATQRMGGIVVYVDTENATSMQNLINLGIDVRKRFIFVQTGCTEDIFQICEDTIMKARAMTKDVPVTIIWDSIAGSSPKAELEGAYDKDTIGLQARVLGKGLRKITNVIGNQNVLMVLINQQRQKIGVMFGDNCVDPDTRIKVRRRVSN